MFIYNQLNRESCGLRNKNKKSINIYINQDILHCITSLLSGCIE